MKFSKNKLLCIRPALKLRFCVNLINISPVDFALALCPKIDNNFYLYLFKRTCLGSVGHKTDRAHYVEKQPSFLTSSTIFLEARIKGLFVYRVASLCETNNLTQETTQSIRLLCKESDVVPSESALPSAKHSCVA